MVSILFALASAFTSALNVVTQHVASTAAPAKDKGWRLARTCSATRYGYSGSALSLAASSSRLSPCTREKYRWCSRSWSPSWCLARDRGSVVAPSVVPAAWVSALVTSAGLALFLVMSEPKGGHPRPTGRARLPALVTFGGLTLALTLLASRGSPVKARSTDASAAGIMAAFWPPS